MGLSLRFPKLIDFDENKSIEYTTTVKKPIDMYNMRIGI